MFIMSLITNILSLILFTFNNNSNLFNKIIFDKHKFKYRYFNKARLYKCN